MNALKPAQVRQYAAQLGIKTEEKNQTNDYYKDVSKKKLINAILSVSLFGSKNDNRSYSIAPRSNCLVFIN